MWDKVFKREREIDILNTDIDSFKMNGVALLC